MMTTVKQKTFYPIIFAILAALFYGFSTPISKMLLDHISPYLLSSLLYFGAGFGMIIIIIVSKKKSYNQRFTFTKQDTPYIIAMILLDILAPILLMTGLLLTTSSNASLLNNLEIVFTAMIAMIFFKEVVGKKMWIAIILIMLAGVMLTFDGITSLSLSFGSVLVILASLCWGFENNCTRMLSHHNPIHVVVIKGIGSGLGALMIAILLQAAAGKWYIIIFGLLLGFVSFGLSLFFYISAQRKLGAARTSAYYATAPFVGALLSFLILQEMITLVFTVAFVIMLIGAYLAILENKSNTRS